jgi:hypothetical protein
LITFDLDSFCFFLAAKEINQLVLPILLAGDSWLYQEMRLFVDAKL